MPAPKKGETVGKVAHATLLGHRLRVYAKPALGKEVIRKSGVYRRSDRVISINERLRTAAVKPATKCKGRPWAEFVECLSREMKAIVGK
jgi:hypothetical protein